LMLDVVEHLRNPETFARQLAEFCAQHQVSQVFVSTGNVAFVIERLALLLGQFNYGRRGILDLTHTRLFTLRTLIRLFKQAGFMVDEIQGIPAPFPLALGSGRIACALLQMNRMLIRIAPRLFAYQFLLVVRPPVPPSALLDQSSAHFAAIVRKPNTKSGQASMGTARA
jgi:hypothetical protein